MSPLVFQALMSMGPAVLSKLFGNDPQKKLQKQIMQLLSPEQQAALTQKFYQANISSPGFSQAQGTIAAGANQASNQVAGNLAARGIGTSGTGAILSGLTPSLVGSQQGQLRAGAMTSAQEQARATTNAQIAALQGTSGPSQTQQYLAGGLESFGPVFESWLKQKFPNSFQPVAAGGANH
jgi:hypothetical protein